MKRSLILGLVGLAATTSSSVGTYTGPGYIYMDNYNSYGPDITYGSGAGGPVGHGLGPGWTAGIYYANGDVLSQVPSDPTGYGIPGGPLTLATGPGSTASFYTTTFSTPGEFWAMVGLNVGGNPGDLITAEVVAYNGAGYVTSTARGHSAPFTMPTFSNVQIPIDYVGIYMPAFSVTVPEPTLMALSGLSGLALCLTRRSRV